MAENMTLALVASILRRYQLMWPSPYQGQQSYAHDHGICLSGLKVGPLCPELTDRKGCPLGGGEVRCSDLSEPFIMPGHGRLLGPASHPP